MTRKMPRIRNDQTPSLKDAYAKCNPRYVCCLINDVHIQETFIHSLQAGSQASHEIPYVHLRVLRGFLSHFRVNSYCRCESYGLHSHCVTHLVGLFHNCCIVVTSSTCDISNEILFVTMLHRTANMLSRVTTVHYMTR